ncbi:MAG: hypothetical protein ACOYLS_13970 [Polymorphobacter sp.]
MTETIAPLLMKWLTHDLATPIATVMTASELLGPVPDAEINGLVLDGAKRLAGRLQIIRAAMAPGSGPMGNAALEKLVRAGLHETPLTWNRTGDSDGALTAVISGAALLLADVRRGQPLTVTATGVYCAAPAALPDAVVASLAGAAPVDARSAVAAMLVASAARAGLVVTATVDGIAWG